MPLPRADRSLRSLPEVVLLLDECGRIDKVSDTQPGERLQRIAFTSGAMIHDVLHPGCDGADCDLMANWLRAWDSQKSGLPFEWLSHSRDANTLLRLRLQPVGYACGVLYGEALRRYEGRSLLFVQDMGAEAAQLRGGTGRDAERPDAERPDAATAYELRRSSDPNPNLVASLDSRLRTVTRRLLGSHEAERQRIARELHDSLGQSLSLLRFEIEACMSRASGDGSFGGASLERPHALTLNALSELRAIAQNLRSAAIDQHGLIGALEVLCDSFRAVCPGVDLALDMSGCPTGMPDELAVTIYRIAQEGLNNIARHANATRALLQCRSSDEGLELTISDNGVGLPAEGPTRRGLGLVTMRERSEILGGRYSITSSPGDGCTVTVSWPKAAVASMR